MTNSSTAADAPPPTLATVSNERATVVVAHRHRVVLDGLVLLLDKIETLQLVGCAETGEGLLDCVSRTQPEIVIFEPFSPEPDGLELLSGLLRASARTKPLVFLENTGRSSLTTVLRYGAWGYLSYRSTSQDIARAVLAVQKGELWVERRVVRDLLLQGVHAQGFPEKSAMEDHVLANVRSELSRRELQVAALAVDGLCNKRISASLSISESTVKAHLVSVFRKLGIRTRTQLAHCLERAAVAPERWERLDRGEL